ncbi:MAG TPA: glycosyltransferase family 2 protein, partial [Prevotellaceae bacterium]|nr:glycosyltransferase family 2 protein [Prevotellaceae bacterium]
MTKQPLYSVIIPHYNSPDVLTRCLASIPDCENIQVIVIDDNSSPIIVDFDHFPGCERTFITLLFNKNNKGAGHARNLG